LAGDLAEAFLAGDLLGDRCLAGDLLRAASLVAAVVVFLGLVFREAAPLIFNSGSSDSFFLEGLRPRAGVVVVFFFSTLEGDFLVAGFAVTFVAGRPRERVSMTIVWVDEVCVQME